MSPDAVSDEVLIVPPAKAPASVSAVTTELAILPVAVAEAAPLSEVTKTNVKSLPEKIDASRFPSTVEFAIGPAEATEALPAALNSDAEMELPP